MMQAVLTALSTQVQRRITALIVAVAAGTTAWILVQTWHGPCMNTDAVFYLSAADNLAAGKGLTDFRGDGLHWFPPGYPVSLAGFELLGIGGVEGGRWLNAALFGVTILICGLWLKTVCRSPVIVMAGVLTIACSQAFHDSAGCIHSEPLYLALMVGSLILVSAALQHDLTRRRALWLLSAAGLLAGLSLTVRYVGVVAIASSSLVVLFWQRSLTAPRARLQAATVFGLATALPVAAVLANNHAGTGSIFGERLDHSTGHTMLDAIELIIRFHGTNRPTFLIGWVMLITAAAILCTTARRDRPRSSPRWLGIDRSAPFAAFWLLYVVTLVVTQPWNSGPVVPRLWLPAAIALLLVGCEGLDAAVSRSSLLKAPREPRLNILLAGVGAAFVLALAYSSYFNSVRARAGILRGHPAGDVVHEVVDSPVLDYLRQHPTDDDIYSNRPASIYLLAGIQPIRHLPAWWPWTSPLTQEDCLRWLTSFSNRSESGRLQIVWFDARRIHDSRIYCDLEALAAGSSHLELVEDLPDGVIYRFGPSD